MTIFPTLIAVLTLISSILNYSKTDENFSDSSANSGESKIDFLFKMFDSGAKLMCKIFHQLLLHFLFLAIPDKISLWQMMQLFLIILNFFFLTILLQIIIKETSRYAQQYMHKAVPKEKSR